MTKRRAFHRFERLEWVTDRMALVDVRWPWLDADGAENGEESSTYALRRGDDGRLKIRMVVMHGAREDTTPDH